MSSGVTATDSSFAATVRPYDPITDALQQLVEFNATPVADRDHTETELIRLLAHRIKQAG